MVDTYQLDGFADSPSFDFDFLTIEEPSNVRKLAKGNSIVHKNGTPNKVSVLIDCLKYVPDSKRQIFLPFLMLMVFGKRNLQKQSVSEAQLSKAELFVYKHIRSQMSDPLRSTRIRSFIDTKDITKRLINFFVVHYVLLHKEVAYFLDKRQYPHRIIGEFNVPFQPEIAKLQEQGAHIVWINLHLEYKLSKTKNGKSNLHAPYARSVSVKGDDNMSYSLCELNFYLWLDDVGGFDAFNHFEADIREKKKQYDEQKRCRDSENTKCKKRKVVLKQTDGRNYKTYITHVCVQQPYDSFQHAAQ